MRCDTALGDHEVPKTSFSSPVYEGEDRASLQVPTLAKDVVASNERSHHDEQSPHPGTIRRPSPGPFTWPIGGYNQHPEDPYKESHSWGHCYPDRTNRMYPGSMYNDPRYGLTRPRPAEPAYAPPQVRSGRGAIRLSGVSRPTTSAAVTPSPAGRPSFPVSNRGKGRKLGAVSPPVTTEAARSSSPSYSSVMLEEAQRIGDSVRGMAVAASRKTKRKLPLARKLDSPTTAYPSVQQA
jgi:hypothetical protein